MLVILSLVPRLPLHEGVSGNKIKIGGVNGLGMRYFNLVEKVVSRVVIKSLSLSN